MIFLICIRYDFKLSSVHRNPHLMKNSGVQCPYFVSKVVAIYLKHITLIRDSFLGQVFYCPYCFGSTMNLNLKI